MKYLYIIFAIVIAASLLSLSFLWSDKKAPDEDIIFIINGHSYSRETVTSHYSKFGYHADNNSEIVATAITRELLIQEAQRQSIDKEADFRSSLQNYFENSLIKILLDRQNDVIRVEVTDKEIDNYIYFLDKRVSFTKLDRIPESQEQAKKASGLSTEAVFDELALPVKLLLSSLSPGSFKVKFDTGHEQYAIRLDNVQLDPDENRVTPDREEIRDILADYKREQVMNEWYRNLKNQASIIIYNKNI